MRLIKLIVLFISIGFCAGTANAQFVQEKRIEENEKYIANQQMEIRVFDSESKKVVSADVNITGLNPRKPVTFEAVSDTTFSIRNYRLYTVSCIQKGYMYYNEKFWPEEAAIHRQDVDLKPLAVGQKTDIRDITFLGDKTSIYPKSKVALNELTEFLKLNPDVKIQVIGHVNGPDNSKSQKFYNKVSKERADAVIAVLVENGIAEDRLTSRGAGNTEMIYPKPSTDWQNEANRRIQIEITSL